MRTQSSESNRKNASRPSGDSSNTPCSGGVKQRIRGRNAPAGDESVAKGRQEGRSRWIQIDRGRAYAVSAVEARMMLERRREA
jgi:hypothetical protein